MSLVASEDSTHDIVVRRLIDYVEQTLASSLLVTFNFPSALMCAVALEHVLNEGPLNSKPQKSCRWFWIHGGTRSEQLLSAALARQLNISECSIYPFLDVLHHTIEQHHLEQEVPWSFVITEIGTFTSTATGCQFEPHF